MEQQSTYAWRCGSSPWWDSTYDKTTSNTEEEGDKKPHNSGYSTSLQAPDEWLLSKSRMEVIHVPYIFYIEEFGSSVWFPLLVSNPYLFTCVSLTVIGRFFMAVFNIVMSSTSISISPVDIFWKEIYIYIYMSLLWASQYRIHKPGAPL